jgi:NAD(P)-dependent dehydrogenase (short-subunit alcohol dehydrogenase family)
MSDDVGGSASTSASGGIGVSFGGRVALVTGGGSGIGRATVQTLVAGGARVAVVDIDLDGARATVDGLGEGAGSARAVEADVTSPAAVEAMVASAVDAFGRLDVAVNAAGISGAYANLHDQAVEEWRRVIDTNLTSVFLCLRAEIPALLATGGGAIVNVASAAGAMGVPGLSHYSASKHGVIGLTKTAALENARAGLRINAVLPGLVRTPMLQRFAGGDAGVDNMGAATPVGRAAEPEEIAQTIVWLCSDAASYVTGHALAVDGGALAT